MIEIGNTLVVFGCSPSLEKIKDKIPQIQKYWITMGLNVFPDIYPDCDYWLWVNSGLFTNLIGKIKARNNIKKYNTKLITTRYVYETEMTEQDNPYYLFKINPDINNVSFINFKELFYYKTVVHTAINYAIVNDYKNVILVGIDFDSSWKHFYNDNTKRDAHMYNKIKHYLYKMQDYINIYKIDAESSLNLPYISIDELLKAS